MMIWLVVSKCFKQSIYDVQPIVVGGDLSEKMVRATWRCVAFGCTIVESCLNKR